MLKLWEATPLLTETLARHWSTDQGTRVRHILWSLYSYSHLVNLGDACTGLDDNLADVLSAAINARLVFGPEVEPFFGIIFRDSDEFARYDREEILTLAEMPVMYPPLPASAETLRQLADAAEWNEKAAEQDDPPNPF